MASLLITGTSSGLGKALASEALARGHSVALGVRDPDVAADLAGRYPATARVIALDLTRRGDPDRAVRETVGYFGGIDALVNNAGYGLLGSLEETGDDALARNLETNFVGPFRLIRSAIPFMRAQGGGRIISISAIAAYANHPGFSVYAAAKAALDAACDAAAQETAAFGIRFTQIIPGPYRTDFISRSMERVPAGAAYASTVGKFGAYLGKIDGAQPGDPVAAARLILDLLDEKNPPFRLIMGRYASAAFQRKLTSNREELDAWRQRGEATDFPAAG